MASPNLIGGTGDGGRPMGERIEPITLLMFAAVVFFTLLLIAVSKWSPEDGQTFQVISGLLTGFGGAFLGRVKPAAQHPPKSGSEKAEGAG